MTECGLQCGKAQRAKNLAELIDAKLIALPPRDFDFRRDLAGAPIYVDWGTIPVATQAEVDSIYERELAESIVTNMEIAHGNSPPEAEEA